MLLELSVVVVVVVVTAAATAAVATDAAVAVVSCFCGRPLLLKPRSKAKKKTLSFMDNWPHNPQCSL